MGDQTVRTDAHTPGRTESFVRVVVTYAVAVLVLRRYRPPRRRWGSVIGPQPDGLTVFAPDGRGYRIPAAVDRHLVRAVVVAWGICRGVRRPG